VRKLSVENSSSVILKEGAAGKLEMKHRAKPSHEEEGETKHKRLTHLLVREDVT
jgi:hypothetical protein